MLKAQRQLQEDMTTFYRGLAESQQREERVAEIKKLAATMKNSPNMLDHYIKDLEAALVVQKRTIVLHFHRCLLSLKYRSSRYQSIKVIVDPDMDISDLRDSADKLQEKFKINSESNVNKQSTDRDIEISTVDKSQETFPDNWKEMFLGDRRLRFRIPSTFKQAKNYYDMRVLNMK